MSFIAYKFIERALIEGQISEIAKLMQEIELLIYSTIILIPLSLYFLNRPCKQKVFKSSDAFMVNYK